MKDGQLSKFIENWKVITHDKNIIDMIAYGDTIEFGDYIPSRHSCLNQYNTEEENLISPEVEKMLRKGIIVECSHEERKYVSPIFITPKSDGSVRLILNLKTLNEKIKFRHFQDIGIINKMGTSKSSLCGNICHEIWAFCKRYNVWITCSYIPGKANIHADLESRRDYKDSN